MEAEIKTLKTEVARISTLERSLKIKTIELNSVKQRGKSEIIDEKSEILLLKDEEITALTR